MTLPAAPAAAEWRRAESANFIVYSDGTEARLRDRVEQLEDFDRLLRLMIAGDQPPASNKLHVYLVSGLSDLQRIRRVPNGIAGFYIASDDGIAALVDRAAEEGGNEVLLHEYAHHFMMQYAAGAYPAWFVEGFAEYFSTARFQPRRIDIGTASPGRGYTVLNGQWLPLDRVLFGDTSGLNRDQMGSYYAQSWLIAHYFYSSAERQAALQRYLAGVGSGNNPMEAFQSATGFTAEAFRAELRNYIRGGQISFRRMTREPPQPTAMTITPLPRAADDLILYEAALRVGIDEETGAAYLPQIRTAAARFPDDPFARRVLAHAELLYGDGVAAERLLDSLIAAAPNDAELLYLRGMRHLTIANRAEDADVAIREARAARQWFGRAHQIDGNHFQTLFRYAQSLRGERNFVSENTSNVLMLAHQLAPQVAAITMNAAMMLMNRGEFADADALLRPLAASPHDVELARAAQELRARAQAGRRPGEIAPDEPTQTTSDRAEK